MNEISRLINMEFMRAVKEKVDAKYDEVKPSLSDTELSKLLFREQLDKNNGELIAAHIQCIHKQLKHIDTDREGVLLEFAKSITLFDNVTGVFKIDGGVYADNFIASQNFYLDAISSCKKNVSNCYQGDIGFACIPLKPRMAVEIYFKNMIGYISSEQECLHGERKGNIKPYPLSIANLLSFFMNRNYKKYIKSPVDLEIINDINYWSNNLVHTGVISLAWQNLEAIELLNKLFNTKHENGSIHIEGFNFLSPDFNQHDLATDLSKFLSSKNKKISINLFKFTSKPFEGAFYYPRT